MTKPLSQETMAKLGRQLDAKHLEQATDLVFQVDTLAEHRLAAGQQGYVETRKAYEWISLQFRVHDLGVIVDRLRGHLEFLGPEERLWGSTYLYLEDPTSVQVIFFEGEL